MLQRSVATRGRFARLHTLALAWTNRLNNSDSPHTRCDKSFSKKRNSRIIFSICVSQMLVAFVSSANDDFRDELNKRRILLDRKLATVTHRRGRRLNPTDGGAGPSSQTWKQKVRWSYLAEIVFSEWESSRLWGENGFKTTAKTFSFHRFPPARVVLPLSGSSIQPANARRHPEISGIVILPALDRHNRRFELKRQKCLSKEKAAWTDLRTTSAVCGLLSLKGRQHFRTSFSFITALLGSHPAKH